MKSTIIFRADFEQPIGPMNPARIKLPGKVGVELYAKAVSEWKARRPGTKIEFTKIAAQGLPGTIQRQLVGFHFERQLSEWEAFDTAETPLRKLTREDWATDNEGRVYLTEGYRLKLEAERTRASEQTISDRKAKALEGK